MFVFLANIIGLDLTGHTDTAWRIIFMAVLTYLTSFCLEPQHYNTIKLNISPHFV